MSAGLGLSLNNALTGLRASQRNISVLSHNIANVNTVGYSRQVVNQESVVVDGIGSGVRIEDVVRNVDRYLQRSLMNQQSGLSRADTIDEFHERLQILLGTPAAQNSIDEHVTTFFNAMQQLSETPERSSLRTNAVEAAKTLAREISSLAYEIENLRYEADREIGQSVTAVNDILSRIDTLNVAVTRSYTLGQPTADLLDQRDILVKDLASYMDISTFVEESGKINILTTNGVSLVDGIPHRLQYSPQISADAFITNNSFSSLTVAVLDNNGVPRPNAQVVISNGQSSEVTNTLTSGSIKGLQELRDVILPDVMEMIDMMASTLRDEVNAIHNSGSAMPGRQVLTGTRQVTTADQYSWTGSVRIGVLQSNGEPVSAGYLDEAYTGFRPLTLDFDFLDSGDGTGKPTMQTIIDEINNHFRAPPAKAKVGTINNIQLVSDVARLPDTDPNFYFDLDIDNISAADSDIFVTGFTVLNDAAANITNVTTAAPQIALNPVNTYTTANGSNNVMVSTVGGLSLNPGDAVYLSPPAGAVNGLTAAQLTGYFTVVSVVGNSIEIQVAGAPAGPGGPVSDASGVYLQQPYDTINAGDKRRTRDSGGQFALDLSGDPTSDYYDISLDIATVNADGGVTTATVTYRIQNNETRLLNDRYDAIAVSGNGERVVPNSSQAPIRAILVDANGNELPKVNGLYSSTEPGYLQLVAPNGYAISIDELDSQQLGNLDTIPPSDVTNRGFSHYFGLNNLFKDPIDYGAEPNLHNAAYELEVEDAIVANPNLIATGKMVLQNQPASDSEPPQWTYVRYNGDNQIAQQMAALASSAVAFTAAGGLPDATISIGGYVSELLGYIAADAASATAEFNNQKVLYDGLSERSQAVSGVNLDEELANTITYQNAYTANARIVSIVDKLFEDLLTMVG